jgi:ribonuclease BN (tRNA processing enzyme)
MSKIIFTGTGSGYPSKDRACSSFILDTGKEFYQFDAGEGFSGSALRLKIKTDNISKVFISHLHPDHIVGIFLELQLMFLDKRRKALDIYLPQEGVQIIGKAANAFYLFADKFPFKFNFRPIKSNLVYRGKGLTVLAYPNKHFVHNEAIIRKRHLPNKMQSYSYIIKYDGKKILYSGDINSVDELTGLIHGVDILITEGMHIEHGPLFELAAENKIKKLIMTHLPDKAYRQAKQIEVSALKCGFKNLILARDGLTVKL